MNWTQQDLDNYHAAMARMKTPSKAQKRPPLNEKVLDKPKPRKGKMNKTEANYALQLAALKQTGEIYHYGFEEVTLKLGNDTRYTPDFFIVRRIEMYGNVEHLFEFHETKGGFIRDDSRVKFQCARKQFPFFKFKMMQCIKGQWNEIYPEN